MKHKDFLKLIGNNDKVTQDNKVTMIKQHDNEGYDKWIKMMKEHNRI